MSVFIVKKELEIQLQIILLVMRTVIMCVLTL